MPLPNSNALFYDLVIQTKHLSGWFSLASMQDAIWRINDEQSIYFVLFNSRHWVRNKIITISQTTFSKSFSCMKIVVFWFEFHRNLFPWGPTNNTSALVQIMAWRRTGGKPLYNQWWHCSRWCIYASLGLDELIYRRQISGWITICKYVSMMYAYHVLNLSL